jgi:antitoxin HigA-1
MRPLGLSINRLALDLHVPVSRRIDIAHEERGITSDTALRLARYFDTSAEYWLNPQGKHEIEVATRQSLQAIQREVLPRLAVAG